mmetsp:Transcript_2995/g.6876  ORF Transcript_2995/g.6876 Transcript_2995/m.6876 type:complete len:114 (+) Transcript_2995:58-399(+)
MCESSSYLRDFDGDGHWCFPFDDKNTEESSFLQPNPLLDFEGDLPLLDLLLLLLLLVLVLDFDLDRELSLLDLDRLPDRLLGWLDDDLDFSEWWCRCLCLCLCCCFSFDFLFT